MAESLPHGELKQDCQSMLRLFTQRHRAARKEFDAALAAYDRRIEELELRCRESLLSEARRCLETTDELKALTSEIIDSTADTSSQPASTP
jgi:hypothetical protein